MSVVINYIQKEGNIVTQHCYNRPSWIVPNSSANDDCDLRRWRSCSLSHPFSPIALKFVAPSSNNSLVASCFQHAQAIILSELLETAVEMHPRRRLLRASESERELNLASGFSKDGDKSLAVVFSPSETREKGGVFEVTAYCIWNFNDQQTLHCPPYCGGKPDNRWFGSMIISLPHIIHSWM